MQAENIHSTFDEIEHTPLRVYNRVVMMNNLHSSISADEAKAYAEQFSESDRKQMFVMMAFIKSKGMEQARKAVTKGLRVVH